MFVGFVKHTTKHKIVQATRKLVYLLEDKGLKMLDCVSVVFNLILPVAVRYNVHDVKDLTIGLFAHQAQIIKVPLLLVMIRVLLKYGDQLLMFLFQMFNSQCKQRPLDLYKVFRQVL